MIFSTKFVSATVERTTMTKNVPAPYLRRSIVLEETPDDAEITVCGLGFYEIFVNGKRITRGHLSPYIVNPDQVLPYDNYDLSSLLHYGENVIAFILGNGMQNAFDGYQWDFQLSRFISAPKLAFALEICEGGKKTVIEADEQVLCHPSPIYFDGLRKGEKYDARREMPDWNLVGCDLSDWTCAIPVRADAGERMLAECRPIVRVREIKPVSITAEDDGFLYDFGENNTGLTRLCINGARGQHVTVDHGELMENGRFSMKNLLFADRQEQIGMPKYLQRTDYICRGFGTETYMPTFTYYGFRYAKVMGISKEQATPELLTFVVMNTNLGDRGNFRCSNDTLNKLQELTRRSTTSNFLHFPNDCPHREKNGWTADAALSAEQTIMNFEPEDNYYMWQKCICRAMRSDGALPGIVPTGGWGFHWGNGPAWDSVLVYLPYFTYVLRGDDRCAREASGAMLRYFHYLGTKLDENGLLCIGLGDWCPAYPKHVAPLIFTDSVIAYDLARKAQYLFNEMGRTAEADYCGTFADKMRSAIRARLLEDESEMRFVGSHQTVQAMALFYGLCDGEDEYSRALDTLIRYVHEKDDHIGTGVLGARVIFRVLCDNGYSDLAIKMITRPDEPSYGCMIERGMTTLCEKITFPFGSQNHHFWGDISALMIEYFAGIRINPRLRGANTAAIAPVFPEGLDYAEAYHNSVAGRIEARWDRSGEEINMQLIVPEGLDAKVIAPAGYTVNGSDKVVAASGVFTFKRKS